MSNYISSNEEFIQKWNGLQNALISPSLFKFDMEFPKIERVVDILRNDEKTRVTLVDVDENKSSEKIHEFKNGNLNVSLNTKFCIANFDLNRFYGKGEFLEDFQEKVMVPWRTFLSSMGFTWKRCYPIIFISGKGCRTMYHMDVSHVLAWQVNGIKEFNSFKDPYQYAPFEKLTLSQFRNQMKISDVPSHPEEDRQSVRMQPGDLLWNQFLTPHWVEGGDDEISMSINISHGGLRFQGKLCEHEDALRKRWVMHPEEASSFSEEVY